MSKDRLKRIQRLEARQPRDTPWVDQFPAALALFAAFEAEHAASASGASLAGDRYPTNRHPMRLSWRCGRATRRMSA
jgi:hypothetical protein